jgi:hypothetical protein
MDVMIFCHGCKVEEMIDFGDAEDWKCPKCNQPERLNPETWNKRLAYKKPDIEAMSPDMRAKYELAKKLLQDSIV